VLTNQAAVITFPGVDGRRNRLTPEDKKARGWRTINGTVLCDEVIAETGLD
jgi:hypothetical protein